MSGRRLSVGSGLIYNVPSFRGLLFFFVGLAFSVLAVGFHSAVIGGLWFFLSSVFVFLVYLLYPKFSLYHVYQGLKGVFLILCIILMFLSWSNVMFESLVLFYAGTILFLAIHLDTDKTAEIISLIKYPILSIHLLSLYSLYEYFSGGTDLLAPQGNNVLAVYNVYSLLLSFIAFRKGSLFLYLSCFASFVFLAFSFSKTGWLLLFCTGLIAFVINTTFKSKALIIVAVLMVIIIFSNEITSAIESKAILSGYRQDGIEHGHFYDRYNIFIDVLDDYLNFEILELLFGSFHPYNVSGLTYNSGTFHSLYLQTLHISGAVGLCFLMVHNIVLALIISRFISESRGLKRSGWGILLM